MPSSQTGSYQVPDLQSLPDSYFECETEVKRSRFLTFIARVSSRSEAIAFQHQLKQKFPDASHHCLAYVAGAPGSSQQGFDDDGEPSGTAGKPMLNVLQHKDIGELVAVVVRYFGGIRLGAGGLVRAYGSAVQAACDQLPLTVKVAKREATIQVDYQNESLLRRVLEEYQGEIFECSYSEQVKVSALLPEDKNNAFSERLIEACSGQASILWDE